MKVAQNKAVAVQLKEDLMKKMPQQTKNNPFLSGKKTATNPFTGQNANAPVQQKANPFAKSNTPPAQMLFGFGGGKKDKSGGGGGSGLSDIIGNIISMLMGLI